VSTSLIVWFGKTKLRTIAEERMMECPGGGRPVADALSGSLDQRRYRTCLEETDGGDFKAVHRNDCDLTG
jgi:hypothetical protein